MGKSQNNLSHLCQLWEAAGARGALWVLASHVQDLQQVEEVVLAKEVRISCCCLITPDEGCSISL